MFTQTEKDYVVSVWKQFVPQAKSREELKIRLELIDSIQRKLEALPVQPPPDRSASDKAEAPA